MPPQEGFLSSMRDDGKDDHKANEAKEEDRDFMERFHSSYRPLLDHPVRRVSVYRWLSGKREDDGIGERLWRVGDCLYDFSEFAVTHPGGEDWLWLSRGTDITEAFNTSHVFIGRAETVLKKYLVRPCPEIPRKSPYTFCRSDFYSKLRDRAAKVGTSF